MDDNESEQDPSDACPWVLTSDLDDYEFTFKFPLNQQISHAPSQQLATSPNPINDTPNSIDKDQNDRSAASHASYETRLEDNRSHGTNSDDDMDTESDDEDNRKSIGGSGVKIGSGSRIEKGWSMKSWMIVESAEEKSLRLSREFERIKEGREEQELGALYDQQKKKESTKELNRIRQKNMRDRKRTLQAKLDPTWVPGKKRVRVFIS